MSEPLGNPELKNFNPSAVHVDLILKLNGKVLGISEISATRTRAIFDMEKAKLVSIRNGYIYLEDPGRVLLDKFINLARETMNNG